MLKRAVASLRREPPRPLAPALPSPTSGAGLGRARGEPHIVGLQAAYARRGISLELGERLALGYQFHISWSREPAIREAVPHYQENMEMFGELRLMRALSDDQNAAKRDPGSSAPSNCGRSRIR